MTLTPDALTLVNSAGQSMYQVDGPIVVSGSTEMRVGAFAIMTGTLQEYGQRAQFTAIAQFYMLVNPGLILTRHVFEGLARPLYCDGAQGRDSEKLIYVRKPAWDYVWEGGPQGKPVKKLPPSDAVFVTLISPNKNHKEQYPKVYGWIERWNWVDEDTGLAEAPLNWVDRYSKKVWTRS